MFTVIRRSRLSHLRSYGVFNLLSTEPLENTHQQPSIDASAEHHAALKPEGSALLGESPHFSPVLHPDPLFNWDDIRHSVQARGLLEYFDLDHLVELHTEMEGLSCQIQDLEGQRRQNHSCESTVDPSLLRAEARRLRLEQNQLKGTLRNLTRQFMKPALRLPNILHPDCPTGSEPKLVRTFKPRSIGRTMSWSDVKNDLHVTSLGTYLTGHLAHLDTSHLNSIRDRWLDPGSHPVVPSYPIHLSDFARGPAVEGCGSSVIDQAIRLVPSPGDLLKQTDQDSSGNETSDWLLNPYTTCYLVGSASLPAFAAYFLRQQVRPGTPLPLRIVSLGSVYERTMSGIEDPVVPYARAFTQRRQLSILEISSNWRSCTEGFDRMLDDLCQFWSRYQPSWSLRLIYIPAFQLAEYEMLRAVVEVIPDINEVSHSSPIQLASVSVLGDWVSRRVTTKVPHRTNQEGESDAYLRQIYVRVVDSRSLLTAFERTGQLTVSSA
ncbi:hypothetical protein CRM22_003640 [Opisthorchis felineus]|uniref:Uncharacterized protein n=1 Tax=Opisthorchis felineus TaxID=147828 RepID=A0A4S2M5A9_OPIFE|nr:hypothetical protein CRM22_003640 [Opisthorchis felineus]